MCGRYALENPDDAFSEIRIPLSFDISQRFNIAPTQKAPIVILEKGAPTARLALWGFLRRGKPLINARAETVETKPSFRDAYRSRRCIVPADGFYEWQRRGSQRSPFVFRRPNIAPMYFAGIWEPHRENVYFSILTTTPIDVVAKLHDRMPLILGSDSVEAWLQGEAAQTMQTQAQQVELTSKELAPLVNSVKHDSREVLYTEPMQRSLF